MDVLLPGQHERLDAWTTRPFSPGTEAGPSERDLRLTFTRELGSEPPGPPAANGRFDAVARAILAYQVFPRHVVRGVLARTPVEVGDTVGISYSVGGGVRLFFAARVIDRFGGRADGCWRAGFTYRTLAGHPELGEETFAVEKDAERGNLRVILRSWSRPGTWLTRAGSPVMRVLQRRANEAALDHLAGVARVVD